MLSSERTATRSGSADRKRYRLRLISNHPPATAASITANKDGLADIRTVSGEFLLSFQNLWRRRGDEILERCADQFPDLCLASMVKLAKVNRVEVGSPGDFAKLGKQGILEKLQEKAGPEARQLFEKFIRDVEKLQAQQEQRDG